MKSSSIALLVCAAALATALGAQHRGEPFTVVETGRSYASVQDAVDAIGIGQGTIEVAPGSYDQCAIQTDGRIAFRAATAGTAVFDGADCHGKTALVLPAAAASVRRFEKR